MEGRRRSCITLAPAFICGHIGADMWLICREWLLWDAQWAAEIQTVNLHKSLQNKHNPVQQCQLHAMEYTQMKMWIFHFDFWGEVLLLMTNGGFWRRDYSKEDITLTEGFISPPVKIRPWMPLRESSAFHRSADITSPLPFVFTLLSSPLLSAGPEPAPAPPLPLPFLSFSWSHLSSCASLSLSLCQSRFSPPVPPSLPGSDSGEPISSWSCLLFATVNSVYGKMASSLHRGPFHLDKLAPLP